VEDARHHDASSYDSVKHNVPPLFHPAQARPDVIAGAAQLRLIDEALAARF